MLPLRKTHPLLKMMNNSVVDLPAPINISYWWNYGSILGLFLSIQLITGIMLASHYTPHIDMAFYSMTHISREVNWGWLMHSAHMNGASLFFLFMYIHMARGIFYCSYYHKETWNIGVTIYILTMATAFMGYVLPWGQMSFWGATVITNIFSAIPYLGMPIVEWIWGGFSVSDATLHRFFTMHYLFPFIITTMAAIHLLFLHTKGSNNPLGLNPNSDRIPFHPYFTYKDSLGFSAITFIFIMILLFFPDSLTDPENFIEANPLTTPTHIQPEWYFLWLYAILRSIPNKLGGVMALIMAILMLFTLNINNSFSKSMNYNLLSYFMFWIFINSWLVLSWIGSKPVEEPYVSIGQMATMLYFMFFFIMTMLNNSWNKNLN